ncbi:SOS response-associated peptidase family protein [Longispora sp. K20-0274]|uniref:SOS response-associated peptidase family protein n=1 Tax=Longispora sp. K20-0274 TaxID=3088255 RepID=UPI0039995118
MEVARTVLRGPRRGNTSGLPDTGGKNAKLPWYLSPDGDQLLHLAGLYSWWRVKDVPDADAPGAWLLTATILTTAATDGMGVIHDRTPLLVPREAWSDWLDRDQQDAHAALGLLEPATTVVRAHRVGTAVNSVANDGPHLIEPV